MEKLLSKRDTVTPGELAGTNDSSVYTVQGEACGLQFICVSILVQNRERERALVSKRSANWKPQLTDTSKITANSILAAVKLRVAVVSGSTQNWFHCSLRKIQSTLLYYNKMNSVRRGIYHSPSQKFNTFTIVLILRKYILQQLHYTKVFIYSATDALVSCLKKQH